jgi:Phage integrase family
VVLSSAYLCQPIGTAGVDLRTVAELMGHNTIQMTMRYAHLAPAHQVAAVERLISAPQAELQSSSGPGLPPRVAPIPEPQPGVLLSEPSATPSAHQLGRAALQAT